MARRQFPADFLWGVAAASYQVEGAAREDGRGESIWDTFSRKPGAVLHGHTGDVSVDQYHRYEEDAGLMKDLGVGSYRFSLAWPRLQPTGSGSFNSRGFDYYKRLCDSLHQRGISAAATLYHWDLPQPLEDAGGWPHRDTACRFAEYAEACFTELGNHVDLWITLNEPWCSAVLGYHEGVHAPGRRDLSAAWAASHHLLLGHGLALQAYREQGGRSEQPIGITLNIDTPRPATQDSRDVLAADRAMDLRTRMYFDPLFGKGYPERHFEAYPGETRPEVRAGDLEIIAGKIDFLGLNYYFEPVMAFDPDHPEGFRVAPDYHETTAMGWPVTPRGLYRQLTWVARETRGQCPLYITENGCAMEDSLSDDGLRCRDPRRIQYLRDHFSAALDAIEEGVDLRGYFVWSLIDNFEWALGYTKRFGIIYADYINQRRVPKDSFYYLREVISQSEDF
ncbi:GH1 family beta-glucosidase [Alkalispirochaeta alkalica]|uniref:GH1 family beta-glucosidase n=1 Tax=Alkalispirochaeta alkalica TaxID=46356 RepID=UPI0003780C6D|nr:GH1 family beta-glucosidase [Alkalispirochaeta alkalica]